MKKVEEFNKIVEDILNNDKFNKLKEQPHHGINRYEHSYHVAIWIYKICKLFNSKNLTKITRASLLHDFYEDIDLKGNGLQRLARHSKAALKNSEEYFKLDDMQKNIIKTHMFPCSLDIPKYKESWLITIIDKIVSTYEMIRYKIPMNVGKGIKYIFKIK